METCVSAGFCKDGYVMDIEGNCVVPEECPPSKALCHRARHIYGTLFADLPNRMVPLSRQCEAIFERKRSPAPIRFWALDLTWSYSLSYPYRLCFHCHDIKHVLCVAGIPYLGLFCTVCTSIRSRQEHCDIWHLSHGFAQCNRAI